MKILPAIAVAAALAATPALADLLVPPSGDNQRATVSQKIGPVEVSIDYSSPRVTLKGDNRRGKIWGQLVPYGLVELSPTCPKCPWRAGANENTVFTVSSDVQVQGKPLPAGRYGLHMIPGKDEFTLIFSRNSSSWGSYSYDAAEDALRVTAKPAKSDYHEWLTYDFTEREPTRATVALKWEDLQVPFTVAVGNAPQLYVAGFREALRGATGFDWHNLEAAAAYCLQNKVDLPEAERWAERAADPQAGGEESFATLLLLSRAQEANGKADAARATLEKALASPAAGPLDLHQAGRQLLAAGKKEEALRIFQANAKRFPDRWPVHVGLMRGYAAMGDKARALEEAHLAQKQAPDEANRKNLDSAIKSLEEGRKLD